MGFNLKTQVLPLAAGLFVASASAQSSAAYYAQCGGSGWTGATLCISGAVCSSQNAFYYQCVQGTATNSVATASAASAIPTSASVVAPSPSAQASSQAVVASSAQVAVASSTKKICTGSSTFATSVVAASPTPSQAQALTSSIVSSVEPSVVASSSAISSAVQVAVVSSSSAASVATSVASTASTASTASSGTKYLMVFGDSYTSDGFWAGSDTPSASLPLGVTLPGTTTDGGLGWLGVTATELNSSLILAYDFAEYGATTDNSLVNGATDDLISQVLEFEDYVAHNSSTAAWTSDNTMAIVWMGINDVGNSYWDGFVTPFDDVLDMYFAQLQKLYDAGIRYFTLFMIPPFDQAPVFAEQTTQDMDYVRSNITTYNEDLVTRLATFKTANTGITGQVFNTSASFWAALDSPSTYNATDATCMNSDGTTCLWYDTYHPGQAIQKLVAQNFVDALTGTFF